MTTPQPADDGVKRRYEQNMAALAAANPLLAARIVHNVSTGRDSAADIAQAGNFGPDISAYLNATKGGA